MTFASSRIRGQVSNWRVSDVESLSLHRYILFDLGTCSRRSSLPCHGWAVDKIDRNLLSAAFALLDRFPPDSANAVEEARNLEDWITQAADRCVPKRPSAMSRKPVYWWNDEIAALRRDSLKARRSFQRSMSRPGEAACRVLLDRWKEARKLLSIAIKAAKERSWSDLIAIVDNDPWGKPYRTVMKRFRRSNPIPGIELPGRLEWIVDALFPLSPALPRTPAVNDCVATPFSLGEIVSAAKGLPNRKAPGPDGISNELVKAAVLSNPKRFHTTFNKCLTEGSFPAPWKIGKLVLLRKLGKPLDSPSAYRPICLLDGCGKLLEKLISSRLRGHLTGNFALTKNQYGFRRGRSTLDALDHLKSIVQAATTGHVYHHKLVGMMTLDVRNAFNSAP